MFRICFTLFVAITLMPLSTFAQDKVWMDYEDGMVNQLMSEGETVLVLYTVPWCKTCVAQETAIDKLRDANPAYEALQYVRVNWDDFESRPIVRDWDVFGRSTILLVHTGGEISNIFADASRSEIQALMDKGIASTE